MKNIFFRGFALLAVFYSSSIFSSHGIEHELAGNVARVAHGLFAGQHVDQTEMREIFDDIEKIEKIKDHRSDRGRDSEGSRESNQSTASCHSDLSISSREAVEDMEKIMDACFEDPDKTPAKQEERKKFISMLHSLENSVPPGIMAQAVEMIAEKLFG